MPLPRRGIDCSSTRSADGKRFAVLDGGGPGLLVRLAIPAPQRSRRAQRAAGQSESATHTLSALTRILYLLHPPGSGVPPDPAGSCRGSPYLRVRPPVHLRELAARHVGPQLRLWVRPAETRGIRTTFALDDFPLCLVADMSRFLYVL